MSEPKDGGGLISGWVQYVFLSVLLAYEAFFYILSILKVFRDRREIRERNEKRRRTAKRFAITHDKDKERSVKGRESFQERRLMSSSASARKLHMVTRHSCDDRTRGPCIKEQLEVERKLVADSPDTDRKGSHQVDPSESNIHLMIAHDTAAVPQFQNEARSTDLTHAASAMAVILKTILNTDTISLRSQQSEEKQDVLNSKPERLKPLHMAVQSKALTFDEADDSDNQVINQPPPTE